ncbi:hypothetical protein BD779DRAFT_1549652 [Infundibulicybe gibba]|nr:hypothetical protein BD779DRAFT_1549652 [Infundibulicybe gibba]
MSPHHLPRFPAPCAAYRMPARVPSGGSQATLCCTLHLPSCDDQIRIAIDWRPGWCTCIPQAPRRSFWKIFIQHPKPLPSHPTLNLTQQVVCSHTHSIKWFADHFTRSSSLLCLILTLQRRLGMTGKWNYGESRHREQHGVCTISSWSRGLLQVSSALSRLPVNTAVCTSREWFVHHLMLTLPLTAVPHYTSYLSCNVIAEGQRGTALRRIIGTTG